MQRHQGGGTGGVYGQAGAVQIEEVGEAVSGNAEGAARANVRVADLGVVKLHLAVFHARNTDKDACLCAAQLVRGNAGIFQRLPGHLQQQPLLRVHSFCLARGNTEKAGVELVNFFQKTAPAGIHFAGLGVWVIEGGQVPARCRHFTDGIHAISQQFPKRLRPICPRKPASQPHNSHLACCLLPVICYLLPVACSLLPVICYLLPVACSLLPVIC